MSSEQIPQRLRIQNRDSDGNPEYHDTLGEGKLSVEEKRFLCEELLDQHNYLRSSSGFQGEGTAYHSVRGLADRYGIAFDTLKEWKKKFKKDENCFHDSAGRPGKVDSLGIDSITAAAVCARAENKSLTKMDVDAIVLENENETRKRRGMIEVAPADGMSSRSIKRRKIEAQVETVQGQRTTTARWQALSDVLVTLKTACLIKAFAEFLPAEYKWNADATTIEICPGGKIDDQKLEVVILDRDYEKTHPVTTTTNETTSAFIKWFHIGSAAGQAGPIVLVVADRNMPVGQFSVHQVKGLGSSKDLTSVGWLYICKDRAGNPEMWKHFMLNIVAPLMKQCYETYRDLSDFYRNARLFLSTDGEMIILREVLESAEVLEAFMEARTDYMKGPPSGTSRHQPSDVSTNFRDVKTGMREVMKKGFTTSCKLLEHNLQLAFDAHNAKYHAGTNAESNKIDGEYRRKIMYGISSLVHVLRCKYFDSEKIVKGFTDCGQHVVGKEPGEVTIDFDAIMRRSFADVSSDKYEFLMSKVDEITDEFRLRGSVSNEFLANIGIPFDENFLNRDNLVIWRQDAQLITHADTVEKYRIRRERDTFLQSEANVQKKSVVDEALKVARKYATAAKSTATRTLKAQERKAEEAIKYAGKSVKDVKVLKAREKQDKKQQKEEEKRRAMEILGDDTFHHVASGGKTDKATYNGLIGLPSESLLVASSSSSSGRVPLPSDDDMGEEDEEERHQIGDDLEEEDDMMDEE